MQLEKVIKPWGSYTNILEEEYTKVKKISIDPGESPSYQYHFKRSEVWVLVKGTAKVKINDLFYEYKSGDILFIPKEAKHQITNIGSEELVFIEIQMGEYFGEDDIVRLEDNYGRI
jgi:mannose-6-phosphate isomerase